MPFSSKKNDEIKDKKLKNDVLIRYRCCIKKNYQIDLDTIKI